MKKLYILLLATLLVSCLKEEELNQLYEGYLPVDMKDGLAISSPEAEGIDPLILDDIYALTYTDDRFWSIRSLLVFRNGKLVSECYHKNPDDISTRHLIWSCTKQVLGVLTGIAIEQGVIASLDDPMSIYLESVKEDHPDKAAITLRDLLTMSSGIDYENDGLSGDTDKLLRQKPDNMTEYILSRPMLYKPGEVAYYKDGDPHLMASVLQVQLGQPLDEWADRVLFSKIGVENLHWVRYKDGSTLGAYGIETTPRELAKIALLVQNMGIHGSDTIVSREWIMEMTEAKKEQYGVHLGYYWWSDVSRGVHLMAGHGGQYAIIDPENDLLVVTSAIPNTQGQYQLNMPEVLDLTDLIIEACNN